MDPALHLNWAKVAITGAPRGSGQGVVWNSDWCAGIASVCVPQQASGAGSDPLCSSTDPLWSEGAEAERK